ncbi:MAG: VIT1/CCC1 transporter family protein [Candidatus Diapherotrites archaeon]|uniref:VIT1/CCC1 transporter family protein n=1 Tax=Candidatus Iainarchaeum sp. TaxID=3101447 RepID=A0A8T4L6R5_9ARCH|nr:VIT1/CCC1 transporter family protein [Candidatus Diapherotrites archaeon]
MALESQATKIKMTAAEAEKWHKENHDIEAGSWLREFILGCQDGVVNVSGIVLGVAMGTQSAPITILAGLAATFAESISMAAVAYTSSKSSADFFDRQRQQELHEIEVIPEIEKQEIRSIYEKKGFSGKLLDDVVEKITSDKNVWADTMMVDELHLSQEAHDPVKQGFIVGLSAIVGSFVPLVPFFLVPSISIAQAMMLSLGLAGLALFIMGAVKGKLTAQDMWKSGLEILVVGLLAAFAGFLVGAYFGVPSA